MESLQPKKRKFSRRLVVANILAAWALLFWAAYTDELSAVLATLLTFITSNIAIYTGIGHMDFRKMIDREAHTERSRPE